MTMDVKTVRDDLFACNVYRVGDALVDAGDDPDRLPPEDEIDAVYLTHTHPDHVAALAGGGYEATVYVHPKEADSEALDGYDVRTVEDGETVRVGGVDAEVMHTPGHSPGSVCYRCGGEALFSGDLVFDNGAPGRSDTPDGDPDALRRSLERLADLEPEPDTVYPGHRDPFGDLAARVRVAVNLV